MQPMTGYINPFSIITCAVLNYEAEQDLVMWSVSTILSQILSETIKERGYEPAQVSNCNETGMFYTKTGNKTYLRNQKNGDQWFQGLLETK
jgi:hypothetical protein